MAPLTRHPVALAIVLAAVIAIGAVFVFARPAYHAPRTGPTIELPPKRPADDAPGAAGWRWSDGVPGWAAGETIKGVDISGFQPIELQAAQLTAARNGLDADKVRVVSLTRPNRNGMLAIVAAPTLYEDTVTTCLAAVLQGDAPVVWHCPRDLANARVLAAAAMFTWPPDFANARPRHVLYLAGVARGDVRRVVLTGPGVEPQTIYTRGPTWGQLAAAETLPQGVARLVVYGRRGEVETVPLDMRPGTQRVIG